MEKKDLLKFANIAAITYEDPKDSKKKFKDQGYDIVEFFNIKGAQAYLLKRTEVFKDEYVLSFRGTESAGDVLADLKARMKTESSGGDVHRGFKGELDKLWPSIEKDLAKIDTLYVTGHSLGAAMATIAASRIQDKVLALVTFGSPRVGTRAFVNSLKVTHYRVQNNCDDVTKVPLLLMGYRHHGTHKYMNFYGEFRTFTTWQKIKDMVRSRLKARMKKQKFIGVFDHLMKNYIKKLEKGE
jgi:triacylglycerol lipase